MALKIELRTGQLRRFLGGGAPRDLNYRATPSMLRIAMQSEFSEILFRFLRKQSSGIITTTAAAQAVVAAAATAAAAAAAAVANSLRGHFHQQLSPSFSGFVDLIFSV